MGLGVGGGVGSLSAAGLLFDVEADILHGMGSGMGMRAVGSGMFWGKIVFGGG